MKETRLNDNANIYQQRNENKSEKEKWKDMNRSERINYFKDYYLKKVLIGGILIVIIVSLCYTIWGPHTEPKLFIASVDLAMDSETCENVHKDLLDVFEVNHDNKDHSAIQIDSELYYAIESAYGTMATQKLLTYLMAGEIDLFIAPKDTFQFYAYKGYMAPLSEELPSQLFDSLTEHFYTLTPEDETSEQVYGIKLPGLNKYDSRNEPISEPVIGIIVNAPHKKNTLKGFTYFTDHYIE